MKSNSQKYKDFISNQKRRGQAPRPDGGGFFFAVLLAVIIGDMMWYAMHYGVHALTTLLGLS